MAKRKLPAQGLLRQILDYNPDNGWLTWRERPASHFSSNGASVRWHINFCGKRAGCLMPIGYRSIRINDTLYYEHRLIWMLVNGEDPAETIDHINMDRADNRLANLRLADGFEQAWNLRGRTTLPKGVQRSAAISPSYFARIKANGKTTYLGCFKTPELAHDAYKKAAERLHGEFANFGTTKTPA